LIAGSSFGNRPIAVKAGLGSGWAEPGCDANRRKRSRPDRAEHGGARRARIASLLYLPVLMPLRWQTTLPACRGQKAAR
jgi:hypothetical protein